MVTRSRLIEQLNNGLNRKMTLISAPAGFGKTMLVSDWLDHLRETKYEIRDQGDLAKSGIIENRQSTIAIHAAWLSLDDGDNDPTRFLTYLIAALRTIVPGIGEGMLAMLQSAQPPSPESILTVLLNEMSAVGDRILLILDDYHVIDAKPVNAALNFLLEHLPPEMHLVITTREDPQLPLARLRARGQLTELRVTDLRFTPDEAAEFLNQVMELTLSVAEIAALETRTEGWIAGLQLAALSMQGLQDVSTFIQSFTGSHRFVLDYLAEEVLQKQPADVHAFLLRTSILDRLCGPLCDAVLDDPHAASEKTLAYIEQANLFIIPLDNERRWYRYHHLFADLLRQRLAAGQAEKVAQYHIRASIWFEENGLEIEAFQHAAAANDVDRAARLVEGEEMPLHFRGAVAPILNWLASLPETVLNHRPALWVLYASALIFVSQLPDVEPTLQAAEAALKERESDEKTDDLIGHIAAIRATLAVIYYQLETIVEQSHRALAYLHPDNLPVRTATTWTLGVAYQIQGDFAAAGEAYTKAIAISREIGHIIIAIMATIGLGNVQEEEDQLSQAAKTYRDVLQLTGEPPLPVACEAHLGLARIFYAWNDLEAAEHHGRRSVELARQLVDVDRFVGCEVFMARLKLAQNDPVAAADLLAKTERAVQQHNFMQRIPEVAAAQVRTMLYQDQVAAAERLVEAHDLPLSRARVYLAQGDPAAALAVLEPWRHHTESRGWVHQQLQAMVLQVAAHQAVGARETALSVLNQALPLAEPGGSIRLFLDEGEPIANLLPEAAARGVKPMYVSKLLAAFHGEKPKPSDSQRHPPLVDPLSPRELEVLHLIAQGLSNREIAERLFLALSTVKGHNRIIFDKLNVQRRTEAVARAREIGLL